MTSQINLEEVYNELNNLLRDVCSFLDTEVENGTLSATAKNHAEKLLYRSKQQIEIVSKISVLQESTNSNYPYLQMQGPGFVEEPISEYVDADGTNHYEAEDEEENYAEVGLESVSLPPPSSMIIEDLCPFTDLPLSVMSEKAIKFGPLSRKERFIILEQKKHFLVGLIGYWLLIYCPSKKDVKPLQVLNVSEYTARAVEQKKDPIFEMIGKDKKTYEFIAKSVKDMEQWIVAINFKKQKSPYARNLPELPLKEENANEEIDKNANNAASTVEDLDSEQDDYENLDDLRRTDLPSLNPEENEEKTPKLPARQHLNLSVNFSRPSTDNSTYNNVLNSRLLEDDDEDDTYDPVQNSIPEEEEEEEIYDVPKIDEQYKPTPTPTPTQTPAPAPAPLNDYDNEEDEDCIYDIPKVDLQNNKPQQTKEEFEEEDAEYDELKIPENNNENFDKQKPDLRVETTEKVKTLPKPAILSPKPKIQGRVEKQGSFSRKSDNAQEGNSSKKIFNIIQQMEASLNFKGIKN